MLNSIKKMILEVASTEEGSGFLAGALRAAAMASLKKPMPEKEKPERPKEIKPGQIWKGFLPGWGGVPLRICLVLYALGGLDKGRYSVVPMQRLILTNEWLIDSIQVIHGDNFDKLTYLGMFKEPVE